MRGTCPCNELTPLHARELEGQHGHGERFDVLRLDVLPHQSWRCGADPERSRVSIRPPSKRSWPAGNYAW